MLAMKSGLFNTSDREDDKGLHGLSSLVESYLSSLSAMTSSHHQRSKKTGDVECAMQLSGASARFLSVIFEFAIVVE